MVISIYQFLDGVLRLFSSTLNAMIQAPVFAFFLAFFVFAVAYGLWRYLYYTAKSGGGKV